ncbi:TPA: hypothetical protein R4K21_002653 [Stenotrophomonas maltophilia]|nr:hypothetical protein [Stenotrophomonas maltophilia]
MSRTRFPNVIAALGDDAARLPHDLAPKLEDALSAVRANQPRDVAALPSGLRCTCEAEISNEPSWLERPLPPSRCTALARADRAASGLTTLLEILHAAERARMTADSDAQIGDGLHRGLLQACCELAVYVDVQLRAA